MNLAQPGRSILLSYTSFDRNVGLFVASKVYDVTSGTAVLLSTVHLSSDSDGVYKGSFIGVAATSYLVITVVYTDGTYATVDTNFAPSADNFECGYASTVKMNFNYTSFDQSVGLTIAAKVYDTTTGTPVLVATVTMVHVLCGVYFGTYTGAVGSTFAIVKTPTDATLAPGLDAFQCLAITAVTFAGAQGPTPPSPGILDAMMGNGAIDAVLGIRDLIGAVIEPVFFVVRTWTEDTSQTQNGVVATDTELQMFPSPRLKKFYKDIQLKSGGVIQAGDIVLKDISRHIYGEANLDATTGVPNQERLYRVGAKIYQPIHVSEKYVTWEVHLRELTNQARY